MIGALTFLTVVGRSRPPRADDLVWFPVVGALLGAVLGLVWWGAEQVWPDAVAAALVVATDLALTGLLHVDGLADSADGLLPHLAREQRLAVMAAPDVGAFGVATVAATVLVRWSAVAVMPVTGWRAIVLLAAVWAAARSVMVLVMATQPYARGASGLASPFLTVPGRSGTPSRPVAASIPRLASVSAAAALLLAVGAVTVVTASASGMTAITGPAGVAAGAGAGALVAVLARRRIDGYTGDVLGALGLVVETVALVVLAADA